MEPLSVWMAAGVFGKIHWFVVNLSNIILKMGLILDLNDHVFWNIRLRHYLTIFDSSNFVFLNPGQHRCPQRCIHDDWLPVKSVAYSVIKTIIIWLTRVRYNALCLGELKQVNRMIFSRNSKLVFLYGRTCKGKWIRILYSYYLVTLQLFVMALSLLLKWRDVFGEPFFNYNSIGKNLAAKSRDPSSVFRGMV